MDELLEEPPAEKQLTVTEEFLQIVEDFADYIDKFMFEIVTFLAVVDSTMGLIKDVLGMFGVAGWKMAFFPSFSFVVTFSVFLFGSKKRKGKREADEGGLGQALDMLEDVMEVVEDVAEGLEEGTEGQEGKQAGDNADEGQFNEQGNEEGGEEGGEGEETESSPPDGPPPQSTVRRVIGLVIMTASVAMKLKRSISKNQEGEKAPEVTAEQQSNEDAQEVANIANETKSKVPMDKSSSLNQDYAVPREVTLKDVKDEGVDIVRGEIEAVGNTITSTAQSVTQTATMVNEALVTAGQHGIESLNSVPVGAEKLKNEAFAVQREVASTATGVLLSTAGATQTLLSTTQNINAVNNVVTSTTGIVQKPEESAEKLKAETEAIGTVAREETEKMATNVAATAGAATTKAKEGVQAAKKRSGGIIQIGVRLIRLVARVANKNKNQAPVSGSSGGSQAPAPAAGDSTSKVTQPATEKRFGGADAVTGMTEMVGSLTSGAGDVSKDPASAVKKVVGIVVKVVRMVKKNKGGGDMTQGPAELGVSVVSLNGDGDSVYYDCDEKLPDSVLFPRKAVSVSTVGTQTGEIQETSNSNFISREEFEELKRTLSMGPNSIAVEHKKVPFHSHSQILDKSLGQVANEEAKVPRYNTISDVSRTTKVKSAYESSSTLQLSEQDIERMQTSGINNNPESYSVLESCNTENSLNEVKVSHEGLKARGSSVISKISLAAASPSSTSVDHSGFHSNPYLRSVGLNAPVVLHSQRNGGLRSASLSDAALGRRNDYSVRNCETSVNIQSSGNHVLSEYSILGTDVSNVVPHGFHKSVSLDIEKQQITEPFRSRSSNGYTASASEGSEVDLTEHSKRSAANVHFIDEQPISRRMRRMKQAVSEVRLSKGYFDDRVNTSQPNLSFEKPRSSSVIVDIHEPKSLTGYCDDKPGVKCEWGKGERHRQTKPPSYEKIQKDINDSLFRRDVEQTREQEILGTKKNPDKASQAPPSSCYDKTENKKLRGSIQQKAAKKRIPDKHRTSRRKKSFSKGSKKERLKQGDKHRTSTIQSQYKNEENIFVNQISENVAARDGEDTNRSSGQNSRSWKVGNDARLREFSRFGHSVSSDNVGGESSRESSEDIGPNYESTDYA